MKDQELEKLMRQIANDAALDDAAADEIADSPTLWWSVQREIGNAQPAKAPWPPNFLRRLLMIGVPVAAAVLVGLGVYVNSVKTPSGDTAYVPVQTPVAAEPPTATVTAPAPAPATIAAKKNDLRTTTTVKAVQRLHAPQLSRTSTARNTNKPSTEIKSEFIALAYARSPESGQLVRVKVPSSMMVQLGIVPTVRDPTKLVDAEVLVGDDGLTHSIRFISQ